MAKRPSARASNIPKIGCVQHDCARCKARAKALKLTAELLDAIDAGEQDIGGSRPVADILKDLGPAVDRATR